jgi:hypothetical protein
MLIPFPYVAIGCDLWQDLLRRRLDSVFITAEWVALVYPVRGLWQPALVWTSFWCLCSLCHVVFALSWLWSSFLVVLVRIFPLSILSSSVADMFGCGEFPRSVLLLLRSWLFRFLVSLRDSEPIVM